MGQTDQKMVERYRCRACGRAFYVEVAERSPLDLDFGCPYGCDDNGEAGGTASVQPIEVESSRAADGKIRDHRIVLTLCAGDFEASMHRKPRDQEEFDEWAGLAEKGLLNGHIDWGIIYDCTADAMPGEDDDK